MLERYLSTNHCPWRRVEEDMVFLSRVRTQDGRDGIVVDPGAYDNLMGSKWLNRVQSVVDGITLKNMRRLTVGGVGKHHQTANHEATVPIGPEKTYTGPVVVEDEEDSSPGIPALLGLRSMEAKRAILDMRSTERKLYLGGNVRIVADSDTQIVQLEPATSGHLLLPISQSFAVATTSSSSSKAEPARRVTFE